MIIDNEEWEVVENIDECLEGYEYKDYYIDVPRDHVLDAIAKFVRAGVTTNIHYVLSNSSIDEAIARLKEKAFHKGINAVIFLLHKPIGLGSKENVLKVDDPRVKEFFELVDKGDYPFKIGFDSCSISGILNFSKNIHKASIDTCEAGRFSAYITAKGLMIPCSFENQNPVHGVDLNKFTIQEAWDSNEFNAFRKGFEVCPTCKDRANCLGGCPIVREITLCNREERTHEN